MLCVCEHFPDSPPTPSYLLTSSPPHQDTPPPRAPTCCSVPLRSSSSSSGGGVETSRCFPPPSPSTAPFLSHNFEGTAHHQTWVLRVSVRRCSWPLWSASAPRVRTRLAGSRSGSFSTPKRSANLRANTPGSASETTHASAPEATRGRPASMVMIPTFNTPSNVGN